MEDLTDLDAASAKEMLGRLLSQLVTAREAIVTGQRREAGYRKMIDALVEMFPELEDDLPAALDEDEPARPRGAAAVLAILKDNVNNWYQVGAIANMLERRDWLPQSSSPANAVRSALERLVEQGLVQKGKSVQGAVIYRVYDPEAEKDGEPF